MSNKSPIQMRPGAGPHQLHKKKVEKIKDIKGTIKRLLGYLIEKKINIFAKGFTFFTISNNPTNYSQKQGKL